MYVNRWRATLSAACVWRCGRLPGSMDMGCCGDASDAGDSKHSIRGEHIFSEGGDG